MATIRINQLPEDSTPNPNDVVPLDNGTTRNTTIQQLVDTGAPVASQGEAEAGTNATKRMTPLTTKQAIEHIGALHFATPAQLEGQVEDYITTTEDARDDAVQAKNDAEIAQGAAEGAAGTATGAATTAQTARDFAARWASDPEDGTPIDDGANPPGQSAFHWSKKSEGFAGTASDDADRAEAAADTAEAIVGFDGSAATVGFDNTVANLPGAPDDVQAAIEALGRMKVNFRDREYVTSKKWFSGSSAADNGWIGLDYSPEQNLYVAVAADGTDRMMTSKDGINWTSVNVPATVWRTVRWVRELGRWIATGHGTSGAMWSADGVTWNAVTTPDGEWVNFAYSPKLNLLVANNRGSPSSIPNAGQSMVSSDGGETWTLNALPVNNDWLGTCWSDDLEKFIIVGSPRIDGVDEDPYVLTSMDGYNWMGHAIANLEHWWNAIWVPELQLFVAAANNNDPTAGIMTSPDGEAWTARTTPSGSWYDLAWSPSLGLLVCVANNGSNRVMYSTDGIEWVAANPSDGVTTGAQAWRKVVWSEQHKQFVAVATSGTGNRVMVSAPLLPAKFDNANGSYTVYRDGTMEAKQQVVVDLTATSVQIFNMPATFIEMPAMGWSGGPGSIAAGDTDALGDVWIYDTQNPPTNRWIFRTKTAGTTAAYNVQLWARGRWY